MFLNSKDIYDLVRDFNYMVDNKSNYPVCDTTYNNVGAVLEYALAGFSKSDLCVEVDVAKRLLVVKCNVQSEVSHQTKNLQKRIAKRNFVHKFSDPTRTFNLEEVSSKFVDGLLTVTVPFAKYENTNKLLSISIE